MAMKHLPRLQWRSGRTVSVGMIVVLGLSLAASGGLLHWQRDLDTRQARHERELARVDALSSRVAPQRAQIPPALTPAGARQVREQMALLNRDWVRLSELLAPASSDVRLIGMDVNPITGAVRVTGRAATSVAANAYAEALGGRTDALRNVRLLGVERRPDGIRFEASAQWAN